MNNRTKLWIAAALIFAGSLPANAHAAFVTTTFEDISLGSESFLNDAGPSGIFTSSGNSFNNSYDSTWGTWSGWAISNTTDTTTPGYTNQYSAIVGAGAAGSANYGVAFPFGYPVDDPFHPNGSTIDLLPGASPVSIEVTNTTYAYLAMLNGDFFSRNFGAGDFLILDIQGYNGAGGTGTLVNTVEFYLADFTGGKSNLVDEWQTIDLTSLAGSSSLRFGLRSSDNNSLFGMNTPAYFAIDNLVLEVGTTAAVPEPTSLALLISGCVGLVAMRRRSRGLQ